MALVYAAFRTIDADGMVLMSRYNFGINGWVLHRHFRFNIVGNGSSIIVRKCVLEKLGGYDTSLRNAAAEGCEDLLLQLRIAAHFRFGVVAQYLVGYRRRSRSMSSNAEQMTRSGILAVSKAFAECADVPHLSATAMLKRYEWKMLAIVARQGRLGAILRQIGAHPSFLVIALWKCLALGAITINRAISAGISRGFVGQPESCVPLRHFYDFDPDTDIDVPKHTTLTRALNHLAPLDETFRPKDHPAHVFGRGKTRNHPLPDGVRLEATTSLSTREKPHLRTYRIGNTR
jgi:hypothetical protein